MWRTVFLGTLIIAAATADQYPMQEEADCPAKCRCDRNNVACRNTGFKDAQVFQQLHHRAFPHLDTLVMTGNKFNDLSEDLFGDDEVHAEITLLNLTGNAIRRITEETFKSTPNVEFLDLNDNEITSAGRNPFGPMQKVRKLLLKNALGSRSAKSKADLISGMFESNTKSFFHLVEVDLGDNEISILNKDSFCKLESLVRLDLGNNQLSQFDISKDCGKTLQMLDLSNNNFTTFSTEEWDLLSHVTSLDISNNPLECDCRLQPFAEIARQEQKDFLNQEKTICAGPPSMKGKNLFDIKGNLCDKRGSSSVFTFLFLVVIAVVVMYCYKKYRNSLPSLTAPLPYQFGYSNLHEDDDNVPPEFV